MARPQIWINARVLTLDDARPRARGLAIEAGRIRAVFDDPPAGVSGERIDLQGAVVLPGLVDAHLHLRMLGQRDRLLDLRGLDHPGAITEAVQREVRELPPGTWIRGRGWDQHLWPEPVMPSAVWLDDVSPGHPVWLDRVDGHAAWLNAAALARAGITAATADPAGGEILRDDTGAPTGLLIDNAMEIARARLPPDTDADLLSDLEIGAARCRAAGLTGVHDMGTSPAELVQLRTLEEEERLGVRVTCYLFGAPGELAPLLAVAPQRRGLVRVAGVKVFCDGALGSRGAALERPYADRPDTRGLLLHDRDALAAWAVAVHVAGYQLAIHAIGDRAVREALEVITAAQGTDVGLRHRIEHAQILGKVGAPDLARAGVVASMQPIHWAEDRGWVEARLGRERLDRAYAWRRMLEHGVPLAFGSDAPVSSESPWRGAHAAVTRCDPGGEPSPQRLSVGEALRAYTAGAAMAAGDDETGVIRPGARADLTVVDRDPEAIDPEQLLGIETQRLVVGGAEVFRA